MVIASHAYGGPDGEPKQDDVEINADNSQNGIEKNEAGTKDVKASGTRATSMLYTQMLFSLM